MTDKVVVNSDEVNQQLSPDDSSVHLTSSANGNKDGEYLPEDFQSEYVTLNSELKWSPLSSRAKYQSEGFLSATSTGRDNSSVRDLVNGEYKESRLDFAYLTANPLFIRGKSDEFTKIQVLNTTQEWEQIEAEIKSSKLNLRYEKTIATNENLKRVLHDGCRVLHLSGHGLQHRLIFEDQDKLGEAKIITTSELKKLLLGTTATAKTSLEVVVVSACHSFFAGAAFRDNGIKSVVCVKYNTTVDDKAALTFSRSFYNSLFSTKDHTVKNAFDGARTCIEILQGSQVDKYKLLQADEDHKIPPEMGTERNSDNKTEEQSGNVLPKTPLRIGREEEMSNVLDLLSKKSETRVVVVHNASKESGKRAFALMLAHYLSERSTFAFNRIFFFEKGDLYWSERKSFLSTIREQFHRKQSNWDKSQIELFRDLRNNAKGVRGEFR
jgi:hypothetical protein